MAYNRSYINKDTGILHEYFTFYHHKEFRIRNRTEKFMIETLREMCVEPQTINIAEFRQKVINLYEYYIDRNPSHGKVTISKLYKASSIMGKPHLQTRGFSITAPGREIRSVSVHDDVTLSKNADKGFAFSQDDQPYPILTK